MLDGLIYACWLTYNQDKTQEYKTHFSKKEILGLGTCVLAGFDQIVFPILSDNRTLHQILGVNLNETMQMWAAYAETAIAMTGAIYHTKKNIKTKNDFEDKMNSVSRNI